MSDSIEALEAAEQDEDNTASTDGRMGGGSRRDRELELLTSLAADLQLFRDEDGKAFAALPEGGGRAAPVTSWTIRDWLGRRIHVAGRPPVQPATMDEFIGILSARARYDGEMRSVHTRWAFVDGEVWCDLGGDTPRFVRVTPAGWMDETTSPHAFHQTRNGVAMPEPVRGGSVKELRPFVNVASDQDFMLLVGFMVGAMIDEGSFPTLAVQGEQGSGKSVTSDVVCKLLDETTVLRRSYPRNTQELLIVASGHWIPAFDNMSRLPAAASDDLCGVSTGTAFSTRTLYTDADESVIKARRPIVLNGIDDLAERPDLVSRCIVLELPTITGEHQTEREFWERFEEVRPRVFGALLDAVSGSLDNYREVKLPYTPRLADFLAHVTGAEAALGWAPGSFADAYLANLENANHVALDSDPLATALLDYVGQFDVGTVVEKTAAEWLPELAGCWPTAGPRRAGLPGNPLTLSNRLRRLAPALRDVGTMLEFVRLNDRNRTRVIRVLLNDKPPMTQRGQDLAAFEQLARSVSGSHHPVTPSWTRVRDFERRKTE